MKIKTTFSQEEMERLIDDVELLNVRDGIDVSYEILKIVIKNVLCCLEIKEEENR